MMHEGIGANKKKNSLFVVVFKYLVSHTSSFPSVCVKRLNQTLDSVSKDLKKWVDGVGIFFPSPVVLFRFSFFSNKKKVFICVITKRCFPNFLLRNKAKC